jgi:hypothetical protein
MSTESFKFPNSYQSSNLFNPYPANVENMVSSYNASKWQMGFNENLKLTQLQLNSLKPMHPSPAMGVKYCTTV